MGAEKRKATGHTNLSNAGKTAVLEEHGPMHWKIDAGAPANSTKLYIYTLGAGGSPGTPASRVFIYMKSLHG